MKPQTLFNSNLSWKYSKFLKSFIALGAPEIPEQSTQTPIFGLVQNIPQPWFFSSSSPWWRADFAWSRGAGRDRVPRPKRPGPSTHRPAPISARQSGNDRPQKHRWRHTPPPPEVRFVYG